MVQVKECPVCNSGNLKEELIVKDYTVSNEYFSIVKCPSCNFLITSPRPETNDLEKYYQSDDYVSHKDNASGVINELYQIARKFTLHWKHDLVNKRIRDIEPNILDIGCGTGSFLAYMKQKGYVVEGVEPSDEARQHAESKLDQSIYHTISDVKGTYACITLWHVLEHLPTLNESLSQIKSLLNNNGMILIAVPNFESFDARKYEGHWAAYDVPRHLWHFSQSSMNKLATKHGLKIIQTIPMKLDSFYVSMLSEKYQGKNGFMRMISGAVTGLRSNINSGKANQYSSLVYLITK
ncbi:MAG TPA: class I SAM-dependent methyltransferase [Chryseosolibacter sp.]|nr:class I SAM-dependent methyltransferase [Chryseosolibacter sp.]